MNDRDIAKYAAQVAVGTITGNELLDLLGDESVVNEILAIAGATAITTAASDLIDDTVDTAFDVVDSINPFNW